MKKNNTTPIIPYLLAHALGMLFMLAFLGACSNASSDNGTNKTIKFVTDDEEVYEPEISVMHAKSVSVTDAGNGTFRFTFKNLDSEIVHFEEHSSMESGSVSTHDALLRWKEYRDKAQLADSPLPASARQDMNLHITFYHPNTRERYSGVVHMKDLVSYVESSSELTIDGVLGTDNSETELQLGSIFSDITLIIDTAFDLIKSCKSDALGYAECTACVAEPETVLPCAACAAFMYDLNQDGDKCVEAYCGAYMPDVSLQDCRMWMLCMSTGPANPTQCLF